MRQCPNCDKYIDSGSKCPYCRVDTVLYEGIVRMSEKLYNKGLESLNNGNLSQGIQFLTKSIGLNKDNWVARNLLGLALFEIGHIGEALTHWVISDNKFAGDNPAKDYLALAEKNTRYMEKLNDAVAKYNTAILHIRKKNEDLAIVQLKKAVEDNPTFIDAQNLLALCYMIQNDKNRALSAIDKVLEIDSANPTALRYRAILDPGRIITPSSAPDKRPPAAKPGLYSATFNEKRSPRFGTPIAGVITFVIGALCTAAIVYFLVLPSMQNDHAASMLVLEDRIIRMQDDHALAVNELETQNANLTADLNFTRSENRVFGDTILLQDRILTVHQAHWLFQNGEYRDAHDLLVEFDRTGLPFDIIGRMDYIFEHSAQPLANIYFAEGQQSFNDNNMTLALEHLEFAFQFMSADTTPQNQWRETLFMLGSIYYANEELDLAYEKLSELNTIAPGHRPQATGNMLRSIRER